MAKPSGRDIRGEVLAANRRAMQASGASGCNYSALARTLGVRAPSIHHHFATRSELALETTEQYCDEFDSLIAAIDVSDTAAALREYVDLFLSPASEGLLCLCGAVAADWASADPDVRERIERFFTYQLSWLTDRFADGNDRGVVGDRVAAPRLAASLLATLEGALLVAGTGVAADEVLGAASALLELSLVEC